MWESESEKEKNNKRNIYYNNKLSLVNTQTLIQKHMDSKHGTIAIYSVLVQF